MHECTTTCSHTHQAQLYIDPERLRLYVLLAGAMVWEAVGRRVNVCETLDWKRALAVHMWYGCSPTAPIRRAMEEYTQAYQVSQVLHVCLFVNSANFGVCGCILGG